MEKGLNDALVVNEEVHVLSVDNVVVRGKPCQGALEGHEFGIKGRGSKEIGRASCRERVSSPV